MSCVLYNLGSYKHLQMNSRLANDLASDIFQQPLADFLFELNADAFQVRYGHNDSIIAEIPQARADVASVDYEFELTDYNDPSLLRDLFKRIEYQCSDILTSEDTENPRFLTLVALREELERRISHPIYQAEAKREREAAQVEARATHEQEKQRFIKELREQYPWAKDPNCTKNLKKELSSAFPGIKFSVRFRYHGSVTVSWTDGPTSKQVDAISDKYCSGTFDSMTDCAGFDHSAYGEAVEVVLGRAQYLSTSRSLTARFLKDIVLDVCFKYHHDELPFVKESSSGYAWVEGAHQPYCPNASYSLQEWIHRTAHETAEAQQ